ncbi:unnamed protein product [Schistosoma margrebowiei]|uniref:Uncharacterized protein n=1 Tax=Schistosoma margrebowiei TaxID=48269 RepID=A0A3P7WYF2_9TREM|nr:unnamed protein product [Schistosoma margrebowiei]
MSTECTCIPELIFTLGLEPSTVLFKRHRVIYSTTESWQPLACSIG